jgi:hypothetical protein
MFTVRRTLNTESVLYVVAPAFSFFARFRDSTIARRDAILRQIAVFDMSYATSIFQKAGAGGLPLIDFIHTARCFHSRESSSARRRYSAPPACSSDRRGTTRACRRPHAHRFFTAAPPRLSPPLPLRPRLMPPLWRRGAASRHCQTLMSPADSAARCGGAEPRRVLGQPARLKGNIKGRASCFVAEEPAGAEFARTSHGARKKELHLPAKPDMERYQQTPTAASKTC